MNYKFCPRCGAKNSINAKFCDHCGNPLVPLTNMDSQHNTDNQTHVSNRNNRIASRYSYRNIPSQRSFLNRCKVLLSNWITHFKHFWNHLTLKGKIITSVIAVIIVVIMLGGIGGRSTGTNTSSSSNGASSNSSQSSSASNVCNTLNNNLNSLDPGTTDAKEVITNISTSNNNIIVTASSGASREALEDIWGKIYDNGDTDIPVIFKTDTGNKVATGDSNSSTVGWTQ